MHRTDADANVGNMFDPGDDTVPRPATQIDYTWMNDVQENLCQAIEGASFALSKGDGGQLLNAIERLCVKTPVLEAPTLASGASTVTGEPEPRWWIDTCGAIHVEGSMFHSAGDTTTQLVWLGTPLVAAGVHPLGNLKVACYAVNNAGNQQLAFLIITTAGAVSVACSAGAKFFQFSVVYNPTIPAGP